MSEKFYFWLLSLYPESFRREYGAAARDLFRDRLRAESGFLARSGLWWDVLADFAISLPREYRRAARPMPAAHLADGVPVFYTADPFAPRSLALANGAILSLAAFAIVAILLSHWGQPSAFLVGSHHPGTSHFVPAPTKAGPADLSTEVNIRPTPDEPKPSPYFKLILVLDALDLDHDGVISAPEIALAANSLRKLDKNHDGKLTIDECGLKLPRGVDPAAVMQSHPVLAALDVNHDGVISREEIQYASWALHTLDRNHDGKLTIDELLPK